MPPPAMPNVLVGPELEEILANLEKGQTKLEIVDVQRLVQAMEWIFGITAVCTLKTSTGSRYSPQLLHSHICGAQTVLPIVDLTGDVKIMLNDRERDGMADWEVYRPFWEKGYTVSPAQVYAFLGKRLKELPRGGPEEGSDIYTASEAGEELGLEVLHSLHLGVINPDPGIFMTGLMTFCAVMGTKAAQKDDREAVHFTGESFIRPEDALEEINTDDAITLATIRRARLMLPKLARGDGIVPEEMTNQELAALIDFGNRLT